MKRMRIFGLTVMLHLTAVFCLLSMDEHPRASGPLPHEAYVWQRSWDTHLSNALARANESLSGCIVLAAQITFRGEAPHVVRVAVDHEALASQSMPVGLALRIGPCSAALMRSDDTINLVASVAHRIVREARNTGLRLAELQIDFDCAESGLDSYKVWLEAIRERISPTRLTVTVLPCWLEHRRSFRTLVCATDGYVLQVHSFEPPDASAGPLSLCRPELALQAVERAASFGKPFRVALPTYGYVVAFDANDRVLGISAEGPSPGWPEGGLVRTVRSDPADMASLVRRWTADRPANLTGIVWYRLPVETDAMNWSWATLAEVMSGRTPSPALSVCARYPKPGLVELDLVNTGSADAAPDVSVRVQWSNAGVVASDGLGGFAFVPSGPTEYRLRRQADPLASQLAPGETRCIGWIRLDAEKEVCAVVDP
jgi:hypothetical protein